MNTTENNKLIAEFIGFKLTDRVILPEIYKSDECAFSILEFIDMVRESDNLPPCSIQNLKFHSSWDWLMAVVEKIESLPHCQVDIIRYWCRIWYKGGVFDSRDFLKKSTKIEAVYKTCLEFIKWYNEQK